MCQALGSRLRWSGEEPDSPLGLPCPQGNPDQRRSQKDSKEAATVHFGAGRVEAASAGPQRLGQIWKQSRKRERACRLRMDGGGTSHS